MSEKQSKTPKPGDLKKDLPPVDDNVREQMSMVIDPAAEYTISGAAVTEIYRQLDEVPMKYGRVLLPLLQMNLKRVTDSEE